MIDAPNDAELERLRDERDHLRVKLSLAKDGPTREPGELQRLERSIAMLEHGIAERITQVAARLPRGTRARRDDRAGGN